MIPSSYLTAPPAVVSFFTPYVTAIGFESHTAQVAHITILTTITSFTIQYLSGIINPKLFPNYYPTIRKKQVDWDLHVVGFLYALIATPLALSQILSPSSEILANPIFGYALPEAQLSAFATGYFFWDSIVSIANVKTQGIGFCLHGLGCFFAFAGTLKGLLLYCGPDFLIWEMSTIFLNIHWYLDKFGMTGSTFQLINGLFLVGAYVGARLIWGTYNSYKLGILLFGTKNTLGNIKYLYLIINVMLNCLNFFWFNAMINALKKRFSGSDPEAKKQVHEIDGKLGWSKDKKKQ